MHISESQSDFVINHRDDFSKEHYVRFACNQALKTVSAVCVFISLPVPIVNRHHVIELICGYRILVSCGGSGCLIGKGIVEMYSVRNVHFKHGMPCEHHLTVYIPLLVVPY